MAIFDVIAQNNQTEQIYDLPRLCEQAYDFEQNKLLPYFVYENEALKIWVWHTLNESCKKFVFPAFGSGFGQEYYKEFGKSLNDIVENECRRYITETLLVNPYIQNVSFISSNRKGAKLAFEIAITSVYDILKYNFEVYVNE